jgi:hypothetical protein
MDEGNQSCNGHPALLVIPTTQFGTTEALRLFKNLYGTWGAICAKVPKMSAQLPNMATIQTPT